LNFCGHHDRNLTALEASVPVDLRLDGDRLRVSGAPEAVASATQILTRMRDAANDGATLTPDDVTLAARDTLAAQAPAAHPKTIFTTPRGKEVRPKTAGQRAFVDAIASNTLTFGIGPAGTGKTYLAVACAVEALQSERVRRIVLVRPAVEAGERLGFLPGDLTQKVDPYLRPMYDALYEMMGFERVAKSIERNVIEIAPLAFMRGRSLNDSFVILDEAQNTTNEQMKMFLTRIGFGSKAVVTGDITQVDLPNTKQSGLRTVIDILHGVRGIAFTMFSSRDVVRHPLVQRIVQAYEARSSDDGSAA
jgi:phosphate starvation-inducible PhoH-like protein